MAEGLCQVRDNRPLVKLKPGVYTHVNKCRKWLPENMNKTRGEIDKANA